MTIKCMLTCLLLTCCVVVLIIILTGLGDDDEQIAYYATNDFLEKFKNVENQKLMLNNQTKILNLKNFQYVIDAKCNYTSDDSQDFENNISSIKAVWIITSYAGDESKRSALRRAYTTEDLQRLGVRRVFLLGSLDKNAQKKTGVTQSAIENEADRFQDIIQGNFNEAYKNLTYKHLMGLQWAVDKCSDSYSYIMKMDDDIIVNLYEVMAFIQSEVSLNTNDNFLMGYVLEQMKPIRNQGNKWYVSYEEFPHEAYPSFLSGWFYVTNMMTALKLIYQSKRHSNYFWIDDLFITGILRNEAGIHSFKNIKDYYTVDYRFLKCCIEGQLIPPKYKCDFLIGPDGADPSLLPIFQKYSKDCYYQYNCISRPNEMLLKDKCILDYRNSNLGIGSIQEERFSPDLMF